MEADKAKTEQTSDTKRIEDKVDQILVLLTGNGTPERGIIIRLDRLEQREAARKEAEEERSSDLKKFFMPVLQQIFSLGAGALMLLIIQHYYVP